LFGFAPCYEKLFYKTILKLVLKKRKRILFGKSNLKTVLLFRSDNIKKLLDEFVLRSENTFCKWIVTAAMVSAGGSRNNNGGCWAPEVVWWRKWWMLSDSETDGGG